MPAAASEPLHHLEVSLRDVPPPPDSLPASPATNRSGRNFDFWYPTWSTWKFHRTLAYWVSVMYLEGSILFVVGAGFSMTPAVSSEGPLAGKLEKALVSTPYWVGGVCFTLGSYLGLLEALNAPKFTDHIKVYFLPYRKHEWREILAMVSWKAVAGYSLYTVGALFFNVNTTAGFFGLSLTESELFAWAPAIIGAFCFTAGAFLECWANRVWLMEMTSEWWLSVFNLAGSLLFEVSGVAGFCHAQGEAKQLLVNLDYFLGSLCLMLGALFTMWLWKTEQYGLGMLPELNTGVRMREPRESVLSMHAEYGCGRADKNQLLFLSMYLVNASASVVLVGLALALPELGSEQWKVSSEVFEAVVGFMLSHGVMLLGSVVHHVPTARPHNWLLIYMRVVLGLTTISAWYKVAWRIAELA